MCGPQPPAPGRCTCGDVLRGSQCSGIVQKGETHPQSPVCRSEPGPWSVTQESKIPKLSNTFFKCYLLPFFIPPFVGFDSSGLSYFSYLADLPPQLLGRHDIVFGASVSTRSDYLSFLWVVLPSKFEFQINS